MRNISCFFILVFWVLASSNAVAKEKKYGFVEAIVKQAIVDNHYDDGHVEFDQQTFQAVVGDIDQDDIAAAFIFALRNVNPNCPEEKSKPNLEKAVENTVADGGEQFTSSECYVYKKNKKGHIYMVITYNQQNENLKLPGPIQYRNDLYCVFKGQHKGGCYEGDI